MHSLSSWSLAAACAATLAICGCSPKTDHAKANAADARLQAIYSDEWKWREEQFPDNEDAGKKRLPITCPRSTQLPRRCGSRCGRTCSQKLDAIPRAELSPAEQLNYDVYHPQIEGADRRSAIPRIRNARQCGHHLLDGTSATRRAATFGSMQDYRNWIAQMKDIPRYFREQMDEMRAGLKRGFTPPQVTLRAATRSHHRGHRSRHRKRVFSTRRSRTCRASPEADQKTSARSRPSVRSAIPCSRRIGNC